MADEDRLEIGGALVLQDRLQVRSGNPAAAIESSGHSRDLSPFDPLLFGILGARAIARVQLGQYDEAAKSAIKASARPATTSLCPGRAKTRRMPLELSAGLGIPLT